MCGITFAASNPLVERERSTFIQLLYHSAVRGMDSTGVLSIQKDNNKQGNHPVWMKEAVSPAMFLRLKGISQLFTPEGKAVKLLLGHNRLATVGEINRHNAHPFSFGSLIGVHNGTIPQASLKFGKDHETDSEAFLREIAEDGIEAVLKKFQKVSGAFAVAYYDKKEKSLNVVRNLMRPFAFINHSGCLYGASERLMLEWVLDREGRAKLGNNITEPKPWHLYKWAMAEGMHLVPQEIDYRLPTVPVVHHHRRPPDTPYQYIGPRRSSNENVLPFQEKRITPARVFVRVWNTADETFQTVCPFFSILDKDGFAPWETSAEPEKATTIPPPNDFGRKENEPPFDCTIPPKTTDPNTSTSQSDFSDLEVPEFLKRSSSTAAGSVETRLRSALKNLRDVGSADDEADPSYTEHDILEEADIDDDLFIGSDGRIYTGEELDSALSHACGYCGEFFERADVVDKEAHIAGFVYKSDIGLTYVCEPCVQKLQTEAAQHGAKS